MAFSINGIGTIFYGERDYGINGSHITTEWFAIAYIPLAPLRSLRIMPTGISPGYGILENLKLNVRQVLSVYAWFALVICSFVTGTIFESGYLMIPGAVALGAPWFLRRRALNRLAKENERRRMGLPPKAF